MIAIMSEIICALSRLLTSEIECPAGSTLFHEGDSIEHLYVVRSGCLHLVRWGADGTSAVMQRATAGALLAESSIFAAHYHCSAVCMLDSVIARADMREIRQAIDGEAHFAPELARHLAREVRRLRARAELLARRSVADRLDGWLALNGGSLPDKGYWWTVAEDINVSPEALYRELQRRRTADAARCEPEA